MNNQSKIAALVISFSLCLPLSLSLSFSLSFSLSVSAVLGSTAFHTVFDSIMLMLCIINVIYFLHTMDIQDIMDISYDRIKLKLISFLNIFIDKVDHHFFIMKSINAFTKRIAFKRY